MNRNQNKALDLSRTIRLSGLSSGAKLELVVLSRSPSVVSVALQLPDSEIQGATNQRLTDKFSSTTSLWLILRKFESDVAGGLGSKRNFTARGVPQVNDASTTAGRLYHEIPVIHAMGRELASFTDLQKSLGQLGFSSGSALLRLSFRASETPLETAMEEIGQYFKAVEGDKSEGPHAGSVVISESIPEPTQSLSPDVNSEVSEEPPEPDTRSNKDYEPGNQTSTPISPSDELVTTGPDHRPISVFAPPSSTTPQAARKPYNEADYEPTTDHAKVHQSRLSSFTRNKRLPTDAELAAEKEAQRQKAADIKEVEIKIRFPDQTQVVSKFSNLDTASTLYDFVRGLLDNPTEPFLLNFSALRGPQTIPRDDPLKLISGLSMAGRVLVNFSWDEGASAEARRGHVLKTQFREKAREIEIREVEAVDITDERNQRRIVDTGRGGEGKGKGKGMPKWLKLPPRK